MADTNARTIPLQIQASLLPEDQARADLYALLARLLYAGPDARLLQLIRATPELVGSGAGAQAVQSSAIRGEVRGDVHGAATNATLAVAWAELLDQARRAEPQAETQTFDEVFVGTGKAKITPYLTHYLVAQGRERVLVSLRDELAALGLARKGGALEPEDHIAGLCEVMRHLVMQGSGEASLRAQRAFFDRFVRQGFDGLCDAIAKEPALSTFYRAVGTLARTFLRIEAGGFDLLD